MLRGVQAPGETPGDSPLKTHPRQRSIHKLLDTFASIPFGSARPYDEAKKRETAVLDGAYKLLN